MNLEKMTKKELIALIEELQKENEALKVKKVKNERGAGRKAFNEEWMVGYRKFVKAFEKGMAPIEIQKKLGISKATYYRNKHFYETGAVDLKK